MTEPKKIQIEKEGVICANQYDFHNVNDEKNKAFAKLYWITLQRPKLAVELATYRKYVPILLKAYANTDAACAMGYRTLERHEAASSANKNKRWTDFEDEQLIEFACRDGATLVGLSDTFGRTPSAITTRISKLVGLKRISQEIAGRFIGEIDGNQIEGTVHGTLYKGE